MRTCLGRLGVLRALVLPLSAAFAVEGASAADSSAEAMFLTENQTAMMKMMAGLDVRPSGNADRDFAAMMIPHHQGAIDMAKSELRYGKNEQLRRIAQEIIVSQQQEIVAMRLALGQERSSAAPDQAADTAIDAPTGARAALDAGHLSALEFVGSRGAHFKASSTSAPIPVSGATSASVRLNRCAKKDGSL